MTKPGDLSLNSRLDRIEAKIDLLSEQVTILKVKAGLYGAIAGAVLGGLVTRLMG